MAALDRARLATLLDGEQAAYTERHPRSRALFEEASNLLGRVPMTWMSKWAGGFPLDLRDRPKGNRITDVDGRQYVDFALGDTGAMAGHGPAADDRGGPQRSARRGITTMFPTEDAIGSVTN